MRQAMTWILFIAIQAVIALFSWRFWDHLSPFYWAAKRDVLLKSDDDLADSC